MEKMPTKSEITSAFKDFEKSMAKLCEVLKDDRNGKGYVDEVFKSVGEDPFQIWSMEKQLENVQGWVDYLENEINKM